MRVYLISFNLCCQSKKQSDIYLISYYPNVCIDNDIIKCLDAGKCTVLSSLDLSAVFDNVDHTIMYVYAG